MKMNNPDMSQLAPILATMGIFAVIGALIGLAIAILILFLVYKCYVAIPEKHRKMSPGMVWLLLIPCFNLVWIFFVFPGLSKSFKSYFDSVGDNTVGDCGGLLALWYCILAVGSIPLSLVPFLGFLAGLATLVLLIIFLVKSFGLKAKIKA